MFESCVVLDGNQTVLSLPSAYILFESCVVLDGNQTDVVLAVDDVEFESCVYASQILHKQGTVALCSSPLFMLRFE